MSGTRVVGRTNLCDPPPGFTFTTAPPLSALRDDRSRLVHENRPTDGRSHTHAGDADSLLVTDRVVSVFALTFRESCYGFSNLPLELIIAVRFFLFKYTYNIIFCFRGVVIVHNSPLLSIYECVRFASFFSYGFPSFNFFFKRFSAYVLPPRR